MLGVLLLGAGCTSGSDTEGSAADSGGASGEATEEAGWTFTDDRGVVIEADDKPKTIVAQSVAAGGLWEYGIDVAGVFGPLRRADGSPDPAIGLADPDDFVSLGEIEAELSIEAIAAAQPDLIVTTMWGDDHYWGIDDDMAETLEQIAPIAGIRVDNRPIDEPLARFADLAESLGADPDDSELASARQAFEDASSELEAALADKPDLKVIAGSGTPAEMYIAYPPGFPDLNYYQSLGMDLVVPEDHPTSGGFWETLSWEQANLYSADLILADARGGTIEQIMELLPPGADNVPAVAAGQITLWPSLHAYGYGNLAAIMEGLAAEVRSADQDLA